MNYTISVDGCERLSRHVPRKGIAGMWNDQRPGVTRSGRRLQRLFDHETKMFGVIGVKGSRNGGRSR